MVIMIESGPRNLKGNLWKSEITVLECATLLDNELIHRYFPTFLIVIVE